METFGPRSLLYFSWIISSIQRESVAYAVAGHTNSAPIHSQKEGVASPNATTVVTVTKSLPIPSSVLHSQPSAGPTTSSSLTRPRGIAFILPIVLGILVGIICIIVGVWFCARRRRRSGEAGSESSLVANSIIATKISVGNALTDPDSSAGKRRLTQGRLSGGSWIYDEKRIGEAL